MIDESSAVTQVSALRTNSGANAVALSLKAPHSADALVHFAARESERGPSDRDLVRVGVVVSAGRQLCDSKSVEKGLFLEQIVPIARFHPQSAKFTMLPVCMYTVTSRINGAIHSQLSPEVLRQNLIICMLVLRARHKLELIRLHGAICKGPGRGFDLGPFR